MYMIPLIHGMSNVFTALGIAIQTFGG